MDKIYDVETDQKVPVDSKIGKQIIKNYENKLKKFKEVTELMNHSQQTAFKYYCKH